MPLPRLFSAHSTSDGVAKGRDKAAIPLPAHMCPCNASKLRDLLFLREKKKILRPEQRRKEGFWQESAGQCWRGLRKSSIPGKAARCSHGTGSAVHVDSLDLSVCPHRCLWKHHLYMCNIPTPHASVTGLEWGGSKVGMRGSSHI